MRINRVIIHNFRAIRNIELDFDGLVNVIIGYHKRVLRLSLLLFLPCLSNAHIT